MFAATMQTRVVTGTKANVQPNGRWSSLSFDDTAS